MDVLAKWAKELELAAPAGPRVEDVRAEAAADPRLVGDDREYILGRCDQYLLDLQNIEDGLDLLDAERELFASEDTPTLPAS